MHFLIFSKPTLRDIIPGRRYRVEIKPGIADPLMVVFLRISDPPNAQFGDVLCTWGRCSADHVSLL